MTTSTTRRLVIFLGLAVVMGVTRIHLSLLDHSLWDASWGVFFLAGFWLRGQVRWALPLLLAEAVLVDYFVITGQGIDFWSAYCVSPAYWFLAPAYGALWIGGSWLAKRQNGLTLNTLALAVGALLVAEGACYLISNGSYYWLSANVPGPRSFGAWFANLGDWYGSFLIGTAAYVALGGVVHALAAQLARSTQRDRLSQR